MNQVWRLARRPAEGWPSDGGFAHADEPMPEPADGQALTRTIYVSMDPYQWGRHRSGVESGTRLVNTGACAYTPLPRSQW